MAAGCEFPTGSDTTCEIQARWRCTTCRRAICESHAVYNGSRICALCQAEIVAEANRKVTELPGEPIEALKVVYGEERRRCTNEQRMQVVAALGGTVESVGGALYPILRQHWPERTLSSDELAGSPEPITGLDMGSLILSKGFEDYGGTFINSVQIFMSISGALGNFRRTHPKWYQSPKRMKWYLQPYSDGWLNPFVFFAYHMIYPGQVIDTILYGAARMDKDHPLR